jgi:hypothetical protein
MTNPETDEEFEDFLKRRTVLPGSMSVDGKLEPPGALDDMVVKQAREALKAQRQPNRPPRWAMPVALAATVLLCLSVVLNVRLNTNRPTANVQRMTAVNEDKAPESPRTDAMSAPRNNYGPVDATARAESSATASADASAVAPSGRERERRESVTGDIPSHEVILPERKVAGSPAPRPPVVVEPAEGPPPAARAPTASAATPAPITPAPSASAPAPAPTAPELTASGATPSAIAPAPTASAPTPAPAATARTPPAPSAEAPAVVGDARLAEAREQPALAKRKANEVAAAPHPQDPKAWLQQIEALRAQGKNAQADAELRLFRAKFPGYATQPVPPASSEPPK